MKDQLVTVMKFTKMYAVRFAKERLEMEGIECFLTDEGLDIVDPKLPLRWNLKVKVTDVERTVNLLLKLNRRYDFDKIQANNTLRDLKKILVPVDLFDYPDLTSHYAFGLAEKLNAELKFVYVLDAPVLSGTRYTTSWEKHEKIERAEANEKAQSKLVEFSDNLKRQIPKQQLDNVKFHFALHNGTLESTLLALISRYRPDLILMAQKTSDEKEHFAKLTKYLIEHTKIPVFVVPGAAEYDETWKLNVLYATDFHEVGFAALNRLVRIIDPFETKIHCIHIDQEHDPVKPERVQEINQEFKRLYADLNIQAEFYEGANNPLGIEAFVEKNQINLISLPSPRHSFIYKLFHPDIVNSMILSSKVPMLVFPVT